MALNYIWIGFFIVAFVVGVARLAFTGDTSVFPQMQESLIKMAEKGFETSIGLTGMLAFWLGMMKIAERAGLVNSLARMLSPLFTRLFPDIPKGHPATGSIFMNISANMLGLDNAATPMGLKAMQQMQELNPKKDTASNPMIMFLVLNTSGLTIIPVTILSVRAQMGAATPTDVFIPILLATTVATLAGIIVTSIYQRINLFNKTLLLSIGGMCLFMATVMWGFLQLSSDSDAFIEGAKEGFTTAVRIIPYLVAFLVAIGIFQASGTMTWLLDGVKYLVSGIGLDTQFVDALPTAVMKPLTGSGARGMMVETMTTYGPDSFAGRLSCLFQGSTDTTFYILAVYFGSVSIRYTRHAVTCGLLADLAGVIAAIAIAYKKKKKKKTKHNGKS